MTKGKSTWKYNKLLTARRNYFWNGGSYVIGEKGGLPPVNLEPSASFTSIKDIGTTQGIHNTTDLRNSGSTKPATTTGGGGIGAAGFAAIGTQVAADIGKLINAIDSSDIKEKADSMINQASAGQMSTQTSNDNFDTLTSDWVTNANIPHVTAKQMGAKNAGQMFGSAFAAGNQGFAAGASTGNMWAAAGSAAASTGLDIIGNIIRNKKAKKQAARVNEMIDYTRDFNERSLLNRAENLVNTQMSDLQATYAAYGGPINRYDDGGGMANRHQHAEYTMDTFWNSKAGKALKSLWEGDSGGSFSGGKTGGGGYSSTPSFETKYREEQDTTLIPVPLFETFNDAFSKARKRGDTSFEFNGKKYSTELGGGEGTYEAGNRRIRPTGLMMDTIIRKSKVPYTERTWAFGGPINRYGKGGSIHIKPENRGKFTETKRRTGKTTEELTHSSNPLTRKRAIFAQNAKKWHHAFGGELNTQGGDFTNGLLYIDNGGSHEANPYEGVPMGMDPEGTPNLVEEGETIFNDYVFSRRLRVPKALRNKYKLGNVSFADASKKLAKESEERPNDPISMRGLEFFMNDLAASQEELKAKNQERQFAYGGKVNKFDGTTEVSNYMRNPNSDAPYNQSDVWAELIGRQLRKRMEELKSMPDGEEKKAAIKSFYEQANSLQDSYLKDIYNSGATWGGKALKGAGEAHQKLWNDAGYNNFDPDVYNYWYSPRGKSGDRKDTWVDNIIGDLTLNRHLGDKSSISASNYSILSSLAKDLGLNWDSKADDNPFLYFSPIEETSPTTPAEKAAVEQAIQNRYYYNKGTRDNPNWVLLEGQDNAPLWMRNNKYRYSSENARTDGVKGTDYYYDINKDLDLGRNKAEFLRYAPALGFGISALTDTLGLTNKPDYSNADALLNAVQGAGSYQPVRFKPIGNYLTYRPFDRDYYINKMNAEAGASRRMIANTSGGNRATAMAGILAADNNYLNQLGTLARQAEEYNLAQRQQVEDFNRATNTTNSQGFLQADMANQKALAEQKEFMLKGTQAVTEMKERERLATQQNKSANMSGLFQTLGDIGFEAKNDNMTRRLIESGWAPGAEKVHINKANGGKIKRKKKGLTY